MVWFGKATQQAIFAGCGNLKRGETATESRSRETAHLPKGRGAHADVDALRDPTVSSCGVLVLHGGLERVELACGGEKAHTWGRENKHTHNRAHANPHTHTNARRRKYGRAHAHMRTYALADPHTHTLTM